MKKEKPLSEKRIEVGKYHNGMLVYSEKYVIEAVEKLKEDKLLKVGCGEKMENIVMGSKRKLPADVCGRKGFLCFDCKQKLKLQKKIDKIMGEFELKKK